MATQFLPRLSQDLTKLLEDKKNYDVIINVDKSNNKKKFCVHSIILETRSSYFENVLSNKSARKKNNIFNLDFPDISVNVFNILIRYIYGGTIELDDKEPADILNLLIACEKFKLKELYDYVQDYLIENKKDWLSQNCNLIRRVSFKYSEFNKLQNYWTKIVCENPDILFNIAFFTSVDKETLLFLYENKDLCMEENKLWDHIIQWGKFQNAELSKEITGWTANDFNILRETLDDFIPHIRFYEMTSKDFRFKIMPYNAILPDDLYKDLSSYHLVPDWKPRLPRFYNLPSRKADLNIQIVSELINNEKAALISSWIQGNNENKITIKFKRIYYEFQLLTRASRDGFNSKVFHNKCDNKGPTITIMRLKNKTSILGGYNPFSWDGSKRDEWEKTTDSFIFSFDKEPILSRIQNSDRSICQSSGGPDFNDLKLIYCLINDDVKYEKKVYDRKIYDEGSFVINEYEVFSVVRKRE